MINVAKTIYFGCDPTSQSHELPEAEVIPYGDSNAERKKLEVISNRYSDIKEYENIPLPGFTLHKTKNKNYSTSTKWLVIDPRGILVSITTQNLEEILHVTGIIEGLIQQKCVWAREDSDTKMKLVPINSDTYLEAIKNTELLDCKVNMQDVSIGDTVLLQNGLQGTYLGVASLYGTLSNYTTPAEYKPQAFLRRQILEINSDKFFYNADLKILKIIKKDITGMSRADAIKRMNEAIQRKNSYFGSSRYAAMTNSQYFSGDGLIKYVSDISVPKVDITLEEIDIVEAAVLLAEARVREDIGTLVLEKTNKTRYIIDLPYIWGSTIPPSSKFKVCNIVANKNAEDIHKITLGKTRRSIFASAKQQAADDYNLADFKKFYIMIKHVRKETYI